MFVGILSLNLKTAGLFLITAYDIMKNNYFADRWHNKCLNFGIRRQTIGEKLCRVKVKEKSMGEGIADNFDFSYKLAQRFNNPNMRTILDQIESMLEKDLPDMVKQMAAVEYEVRFQSFLKEYQRFKEFILYDTLISKNIIWDGTSFASNLNEFFVSCKDYYQNKLEKQNKWMEELNNTLNLAGQDVVVTSIENILHQLEEECKVLSANQETWREVQWNFFKKLNYVAGVAGVKIPKPSQLERLEEQEPLLMKMLKQYNQKSHLKSDLDSDLSGILEKSLNKVIPVFSKLPGGTEYKDKLLNIIQWFCQKDHIDIPFNQVFITSEKYLQLMTEKLDGGYHEGV